MSSTINRHGIPILDTARPKKKKGKRPAVAAAGAAAEGGVPTNLRDNAKGPGPSSHPHSAARRINCAGLDPCACLVNQHRRRASCESCDSRFFWRATA